MLRCLRQAQNHILYSLIYNICQKWFLELKAPEADLALI